MTILRECTSRIYKEHDSLDLVVGKGKTEIPLYDRKN